MRVALFTCLFVVCFGNKAHQCGDRLGSCGAPRASLMQVGSSNKRRMSLVSQSASRSGSRVSRALAGFEKYTNNLVSKYGTDGGAMNMSNDVISAIDTVREYINGLFYSLNESHYNDIGRIERTCGQSVVDVCKNDFFLTASETGEVPPLTKLNNMEAAKETAREEHVQCRVEEHNDTCQQNTNCAAYDQYRASSDALPTTLADCAFDEKSHLADKFIRTEIVSHRNQMETCLSNFKLWFTPLYDLYKACDRSGDSGAKEGCVDKQKSFEEKHCTYNQQLYDTCGAYDKCISEAQEDCNGTSNTTGLCQEIDILVSARKAENETGERILCLLTVLVDTSDEDKKTELAICTNKTYNTSHFDLDCPGNAGLPVSNPPISCTIEPVSCSQKFLEKYYASSEFDAITGAHNVPYTAVCDCSHECPLHDGEHVAPAWDSNGKCGWLPGWESCAWEPGGDFGDPPNFCPGDDQSIPCPEPA